MDALLEGLEDIEDGAEEEKIVSDPIELGELLVFNPLLAIEYQGETGCGSPCPSRLPEEIKFVEYQRETGCGTHCPPRLSVEVVNGITDDDLANVKDDLAIGKDDLKIPGNKVNPKST